MVAIKKYPANIHRLAVIGAAGSSILNAVAAILKGFV
jgi:hypothetical protein